MVPTPKKALICLQSQSLHGVSRPRPVDRRCTESCDVAGGPFRVYTA